MSFMLLSHVLVSLCLYISSKAMHSYIPTPFGTPGVSYASLFQVLSPQVISFPSGSSQCGANKVERITPRRYAINKRLQVISTSGNVIRTHLSYLLSFKLPPCMICSKLPCLTSLSLCTWFSHYHFVHALRGAYVLSCSSHELVIHLSYSHMWYLYWYHTYGHGSCGFLPCI
jgi:hypothetical protein